jgi:hypothetical protein
MKMSRKLSAAKAKHKQQWGSSKGEMQHQMEGEILNCQSVSSKASPQALVMLGKAGMRSVKRQAGTAGKVAVKTKFWTEWKEDMGNIDPYLKKLVRRWWKCWGKRVQNIGRARRAR